MCSDAIIQQRLRTPTGPFFARFFIGIIPKRLISEIAAWEQQRNAAGARIKWMFTTEKARAKMGRAYPVTSKES
jgi:hypothetical protein